MQRKNHSRKLKRRSTKDWQEIVSKFDQSVNVGLSTKQASQDAGAPLSSIYRWKKHLCDLRADLIKERFYKKVNNSISVLANIKRHNRFDQLEAVFSLLIWYRWPAAQENYDYARMACVTSYVTSAYNVMNIADLPDEYSASP